MEKISRRSAMRATAGVVAGGFLAANAISALADSANASDKTEAGKGKGESIYKFRLGKSPERRYGESFVQQHRRKEFPASATMSATFVHLAPGDFREPHWHPNSDEWLFVMSGGIGMTIVDGEGKASQFRCDREDVAFVPQGFGHYVVNLGDTAADVMVVHNHADFSTVELSDWVAGGKFAVFAATLNLPTESFEKNAPRDQVFIGKMKKPK